MSKMSEKFNNERQSKVSEIIKNERPSRFSEVLVKNGRPSRLTEETTRDETMSYIISPEKNYPNHKPSTEKKSIFAKEIEDFQNEEKKIGIEKPEIFKQKPENTENITKDENFWNNEQIKQNYQKFHTQTQEYSVRVYNDKNINVLKKDIRLENSTEYIDNEETKGNKNNEIQKSRFPDNKYDMIESYMNTPFSKDIDQK